MKHLLKNILGPTTRCIEWPSKSGDTLPNSPAEERIEYTVPGFPPDFPATGGSQVTQQEA